MPSPAQTRAQGRACEGNWFEVERQAHAAVRDERVREPDQARGTCAMGAGLVVCSRMVTVDEGAKSTPILNMPCGVSTGANAKCSMRGGGAPALLAPGRPRVMRYCSVMPPERSLCAHASGQRSWSGLGLHQCILHALHSCSHGCYSC